MRQKILRTIEQVISASKGNIGIFTVSYKFLNKLRKTKIDQQNLQKICEKYKKKYFQEERGLTSQENALLIEDFKGEGERNGAILLGVMGGRNSEGENYHLKNKKNGFYYTHVNEESILNSKVKENKIL